MLHRDVGGKPSGAENERVVAQGADDASKPVWIHLLMQNEACDMISTGGWEKSMANDYT